MPFLDDVVSLAESMPSWLRPSFYGAVLMGGMAILKSMLILPFFSHVTVRQVFVAWLIAALAGAVSGGMWIVASRWIMRIPTIGSYLAGIAMVGTYGATGLIAVTWGVGPGYPMNLPGLIAFLGITLLLGLYLGFCFR